MRNFRIGSVRSLCHAPESVMMPLIIPPHDGASRMSEKIIPRDCVQSGSAV
ncbi:hypothetical protein D3C83_149550 [compost metagenome]